MEIKTFVEVSDKVNKVAMWERVACKYGFCLSLASPFRYIFSLSNFIFLYNSNSSAGCDTYSIQYSLMHFETLNSACR